MADASELKEVEPVTAERVERVRARLLALAEQFMGVAETSLLKHGESPPAYLVDLWNLLGDKAAPERIRYSVAARQQAIEFVQVAARCFEVASGTVPPCAPRSG